MAIVMAIFLYSALYSPNTHPIPALLTEKTGIIPPSKGLSAAFSEIVKGKIAAARSINQHSVAIFGFFAAQLVLRALASTAIKKQWLPSKRIAIIDIALSAILFAGCFAPLIVFTIKLFAQLVQ